jgi:hypothetical protein
VELYESTREGLSAVCLDVIDSEFAGRVPEGVRNVATPAFRALRRSMPEIRIPAEVVDPVEVLELYYRSGNHESHYFTGTALSEVEISGGTFGCYTAGEVVIERCNRYPCATRAYFIIAARKG